MGSCRGPAGCFVALVSANWPLVSCLNAGAVLHLPKAQVGFPSQTTLVRGFPLTCSASPEDLVCFLSALLCEEGFK